ncbi:MAG: glycosyltransferase 87 family protein [Pseudonocardiaceae bacterium]
MSLLDRRPTDSVLYLICAGFAALTLIIGLPTHRVWAMWALPSYLLAMLLGFVLCRDGRRALRYTLLGVATMGTLLAPTAVLISRGAAQPEVTVVERAAARLIDAGSLYPAGAELVTEIQHWGFAAFIPYLPAMAVFGIPHALTNGLPWTDARVAFGLVYVVCVMAVLAHVRGDRGRLWLILVASPLAAMPLATGGHDLPVTGLMLVAVLLAARNRAVCSGLAVGVAGAMKTIAWPLVPALVAATWVRRGARPALMLAAGGLAIPAVVLLAWLPDLDALVMHTVRFPAGIHEGLNPNSSPLPGYLLTEYVPGGRFLALTFLLISAVSIGVSLVLRPPRAEKQAVHRVALGLVLAALFLPATRFGYLLCPLILMLVPWDRVSRSPASTSLIQATSPR